MFPFTCTFFLFLFCNNCLSYWCGFQQSTIPISISRVNQVDAARLDVEMSAMLKEQLVKVFSLMKVQLCMTCNSKLLCERNVCGDFVINLETCLNIFQISFVFWD